ncbi:MAG: hypothetical protein R3C56_03980 [Pirellulaceae bacterium]
MSPPEYMAGILLHYDRRSNGRNGRCRVDNSRYCPDIAPRPARRLRQQLGDQSLGSSGTENGNDTSTMA